MRILAAEVDIFMESKHDELSRRARLWGAALLAVAAAVVIMIAVGRTQTRAAAKARENVEEGCQLIQTIHYARCGHDVTRRVAADKEYKGCTLQQMQQAFSDWSITSFSPSEIEMSCTMQLYCPEHLVVMPDGAGVLGIYENAYGDGYALKAQLDIPLSALPEDLLETVHLGINGLKPLKVDIPRASGYTDRVL